MLTVKLGSKGNDVRELCRLLEIPETDTFTITEAHVLEDFQKSVGLTWDGVCGPNTWYELFIRDRLKRNRCPDIIEDDYKWSAKLLDCDPAAVKSVIDVETGGRTGFVAPGKPQILFEGHIFWKMLAKEGRDPEALSKEYPDIIYKSWVKMNYLGGIREYQRFDKACTISRPAAIRATSWGLFQVMGDNYGLCSCGTPEEFYTKMCESQFRQFTMGVAYIKNNKLGKYLASKDWANFARLYNGPGYLENKYDTKLRKAYEKFSRQ